MSKVVVIESDEAMRTLFREWLIDEGHQVEAWPTPASGRPCNAGLVIVDILDARLHAERALRNVRAWCPDSSIIGMSAQVVRSLGAESALVRALGVARLIAKPCTREEMVAAVAEMVGPGG